MGGRGGVVEILRMVTHKCCGLCIIASLVGLALSTTLESFASAPSLPKSEIPADHDFKGTPDSAERVRLVQVLIHDAI